MSNTNFTIDVIHNNEQPTKEYQELEAVNMDALGFDEPKKEFFKGSLLKIGEKNPFRRWFVWSMVIELTAIVCLIVGLSTNQQSDGILNNTRWGQIKGSPAPDSSLAITIGLSGFNGYEAFEGFVSGNIPFTSFPDCIVNMPGLAVCNDCQRAGKVVLGLFLLSILLLGINIALSSYRLQLRVDEDNIFFKSAGIASSLMNFVLIVAGVTDFTEYCVNGDWTPVLIGATTTVRVGAGMPISAAILLAISFGIQIYLLFPFTVTIERKNFDGDQFNSAFSDGAAASASPMGDKGVDV